MQITTGTMPEQTNTGIEAVSGLSIVFTTKTMVDMDAIARHMVSIFLVFDIT